LNQYIEKFNKIAKEQEPFRDGVKLWSPIESNKNSDIDKVLLIIRKSLKWLGIKPADMVGRCFNMVMGVSHALISEGVKHTITIGDVKVDSKSYFKATIESIYKDFDAGYLPDKPAEAHSWITLEDGTIIDLTILPSIANMKNKKQLKMIQAIYVSKNENCEIKHIPFFLGPMYIVVTGIEPNEKSMQIVGKWLSSIDALHSSN
jgi:hypothetical protein